MPHFRCSRNANIVVLDFPACTAPSRAWSNYSFSRFRGQRLTGRACPGAPFARPSAPSAPRTRAICLLFCAAKVIEPVALAPSARCKLGQSAWTENQLLAHHLHVHCLRPRGAPWHPVIPRCTSTTVISHFAIRGTRNAGFFFFFHLTTIGHNLSVLHEPGTVCELGWNDLEMRPSLLKCSQSHPTDRNALLTAHYQQSRITF